MQIDTPRLVWLSPHKLGLPPLTASTLLPLTGFRVSGRNVSLSSSPSPPSALLSRGTRENNNLVFHFGGETCFAGFLHSPFDRQREGDPGSPSGSPLRKRKGGTPRLLYKQTSSLYSKSPSEREQCWAAVFVAAKEPCGEPESVSYHSTLEILPFLKVDSVQVRDDDSGLVEVSVPTAVVGSMQPGVFKDSQILVCLSHDGFRLNYVVPVVDNTERTLIVRVDHVSSPALRAVRHSEGDDLSLDIDSSETPVNFRSLVVPPLRMIGTSTRVIIRPGDTVLLSPPGSQDRFKYLKSVRIVPADSMGCEAVEFESEQSPYAIAKFFTSGARRTVEELGRPYEDEELRTILMDEGLIRKAMILMTDQIPPLAEGVLTTTEARNTVTSNGGSIGGLSTHAYCSLDGTPTALTGGVSLNKVSVFGQGISAPFETLFGERQCIWMAVNQFNAAAKVTIKGWIEG